VTFAHVSLPTESHRNPPQVPALRIPLFSMTRLHCCNHKTLMRACSNSWANRVPAARQQFLDESCVVVPGGKLIFVTCGKKAG
jgi:hypothetical protein